MPKDIPEKENNLKHYSNVTLERDSHFYDIRVNTNISCVHVPTNIYFKGNVILLFLSDFNMCGYFSLGTGSNFCRGKSLDSDIVVRKT